MERNSIFCIAGIRLDEQGNIHNIAVFAKVIRWKFTTGVWRYMDERGILHG